MYPYPPTPAPAPASATSDKTGNRQKGKKGKQGNKAPQKEKTGTLNTPYHALLSCALLNCTFIATTMAG